LSAKVVSCSTPDAHVLEVVIATSGIDEVPSTEDVPFFVENPSVRLHLTLEIYWRARSGSSAHVYTNETWQLYARSLDDRDLNFVFNDGASPPAAVAQNLPDSYEVESGIKRIRGTAHLVGAGDSLAGDYIVRATWEPAPGGAAMTDKEREKLFNLCKLIANTAQPPDVG
jgi:hypothetical protein